MSSFYSTPPFSQLSNPSQAHLPLIRTTPTPQLREGKQLSEDTQQGHLPPTTAQAGRWTQPGGENPKLLPTSGQVRRLGLPRGEPRGYGQEGPSTVWPGPFPASGTRPYPKPQEGRGSGAQPGCPQAWVLPVPSPPPLLGPGAPGRAAAARGGADWLRFQIWPRPGLRA